MHPAQLRVLPYARSAPDRNKARSHAPVKEHCTRSERVQCLLMGCTAPSVTSKNTELPEWRTPKDPQGLALVPGGGGRAWPGFETTRRAGSSRSGRQAGGPSGRLAAQTPSRQLSARTPSGRAEWAGRRPQAPTRRQAREHKLRGRQAGGSSGRLAAQTPSRQLAARTPSGRAEWAGRAGGPSGRAERAGRAGGPPPPGTNTQNTRIQRGRGPPRQTAQRTPAS